ncbi:MAG TPA: phytase, partial [Vicinamibacteria bacterium]|nr:phytase [Vicinamibacteria bacterium]
AAPAAPVEADSSSHSHNIGPSTTTEPYLLPSITGARTKSILTVGDSVDGYRMVGIPDGLGAFRSGHREFTLLMNHEITAAAPGAIRAHGSNGAFVSRWTIDPETLRVLKGRDNTPSPSKVFTWNVATGKYVAGTTQWQRFCSADLPDEGAFYDSGLGTRDRIHMGGEEVSEGRAWARPVTGPNTGEAWQLPRLGRMAFENAVASPFPQARTIVVLTDDSNLSTSPTPPSGSPSEVYVYVGRKTRHGHPVEQAGLTNGSLFGVTITVNGQPVTEESNEFGLGTATTGYIGKGRFDLFDLGDVSSLDGAGLEAASIAGGVARLQRCEDGAWDPREERRGDFYFVTTASETNNCRLWRLRFDDIEDPERGGTIEIMLRGDEGHKMLDNVTIDRLGRILMDEDPGNSARISKVWLYAIDTREFLQVAAHNPKFFDGSTANNPNFLTQDEESSGIIDAADILGDGWFLLDVQVHKPNLDAELVEGGQLLALFVDPSVGFTSCRSDRDDEDDDDRRHHR